uniref:RING-type domain-containing protein n=3 Tax=Xenopus tropicalis TaxID=8364 RepID=F6PR22_XENTR|eukprot:XP_017945655.1 PREDICTED: uncharacterized protein LOC100491015 [Xenopus tropicalis]
MKIFFPSHPGQEGAGILCTYCAPPVPAAKSCLTCEASLCARHVGMHSQSAQHQMIDSITLFRDNDCSTHQKPLGYYCREEEACMCEDCVPEHGGHRVEKLKQRIEKIKQKLRILQVMHHWDLRDKLSCSLCRGFYSHPITLPCGHSFCLRCIWRRWDPAMRHNKTMYCTECYQQYVKPPSLSINQALNTIVHIFTINLPESDFPRNICLSCICSVVPSAVAATKSCLHCAASLCEHHGKEHKQSLGHVLTKSNARCYTHQELLRYRCTEHGFRVCVSCCLAGGHRGHGVELLNKASQIRKTEGLRDKLSCSICREIYTDPVTLPCGQNYCLRCIGGTWGEQKEKREGRSCPECKHKIKIKMELSKNHSLCNIVQFLLPPPEQRDPAGTYCTYCIHSLVPAAKSCLLCEASLCARHVRVHSRAAEHVLTEPTASFGHRNCSAHGELLRYRCTEDGAPVCVSCCLAGEHQGHKVDMFHGVQE